MSTEFEPVIGLEVHIQLSTESKMYSTAKARLHHEASVAEEPVNANTTPVCAGHPGTLPVVNKKAVEYAVMAGLATHCKINTTSVFARKHYFYPDLPKGYQISQFDQPLCEHGFLDIEWKDEKSGQECTKRIGITRIHMEEDAGKNVHLSGFSLVNLNRAGVPLIEVVSEPDFRSAEEAGAYLRKLYAIVTTLGVCDGNLQEGNFRCDANVSIRPVGQEKFGTRAEIKNVNSFRFVEKAIEVEIERQKAVISSGQKVIQETRLYDSAKNTTVSMRAKEEADDYRYFPDPDLPPLVLSNEDIETLRKRIPELPDQKRDRFVTEYGLSRYDATVITGDQTWSQLFEAAVKRAPNDAKTISNLLTGEVARLVKDREGGLATTHLKAEHLSDLSLAIAQKIVSVTAAKHVIAVVLDSGESALATIDRLGLKQVNDTGAIETMVDQVIAHNPKQTEEFRAGKDKLLGFFVGQVMKAMGGKGNPAMIQEIVIKKLKS